MMARTEFSGGGERALESNYGYGLVSGQFVKFDPTASFQEPAPAGMQFSGYDFVSAEVVAYNSTTDHIYAYTSDGRFCLIDPQTNEISELNTGVTPMTELAYDPLTKAMYGLRYGVVYSVNMADGTTVPVNEMQTGGNNWVAFAINNDGEMYAILNTFSSTTSDLYRISTVSWNSERIGKVPYRTEYAQSMAFNRDNGTLYWWQTSSAGNNFLKINTTTAACTAIWPNNGYQVYGMFFKYAPKTYNITYATVENGSFSGPALAAENDEITVVVTPEMGYRLGTLTWNGNEIDVEAGAPYVFTMPGEDVLVSGSFLLSLHNIIVVDPVNGTLATDPEAEGIYGNTITVLPTPDPGFGVQSITYTANNYSTTITSEPWEFIMPDYDVTVNAVYEQTGENLISIATDYYGYFDDVVTIAVDLTNDNYVAGTEMIIDLGENLTFVEGSLALSDRAENQSTNGWTVTGNVLPGNRLKVTTFNLVKDYYVGNEGTIFTFQVRCARVVSINELAISGLIVGTPDATQLEVGISNGQLQILDVEMNQPESQVVCNQATTAAIAFTSEIAETEGEITYAWTNDNTTIGLPAEGTGDIAAFTAINEGTEAVVANLTVTPTLMHNGNPCVGSTLQFTITVNPTGFVNAVDNIEVHNGDLIDEIVFTTPLEDGEVTYAWENDNAEIGLAASGEGNIPAFTAVNELVSETVVATVTVTPTYTNEEVSCVGEPISFTITVLPTHHYITVLDPKDGELATDPAEVGTWQETVTVLPTPDPGFSVGNITVAYNGEEEVITEEPWEFVMPDYDVTVSAQYIQTGVNTLSIGTDYYGYFDDIVTVAVELANDNYVAATQMDIALGENLTFVPGSLALTERAGEGWEIFGNVLANNVLRVNVFNAGLAQYEGNEGAIFTFQVQCARVESINALAISGVSGATPDATSLVFVSEDGQLEIKDVVMDQPEDQVVCNGDLTAAIEFTTTIDPEEGPITYNWTNDNVTIGLVAEGEGNIDAFEAINAGNEVVVANLTVTPTLIHNGNPCVGSTKVFTITVNPTPVMVAVEPIVVCNGNEVAEIVFANTTTDGEVTYAWTNDNETIGLAAEGEGNIAAFEAINMGGTFTVANISVVPTYINNGISCVGEPMAFTITVNPTPVMEEVANQVVCNGEEVAAIEFASNITDENVTYAWTNDNTEIGLDAEGMGNIAAFTGVNTTNMILVANVTVTPTYTFEGVSCEGEAMTFTITVNPTPTVDAVADQVVCNGAMTEAIAFTGAVEGTTFSWVNENETIGLAAEGEGNINAFAAINEGTAAVTTTITVTPAANGCVGEPVSFNITVNPAPVMDAVEDIVVCDESEVTVIFNTPITDGEMVYSWTNDNPNIGLVEAGEDDITFLAVNLTGEPEVANIIVTPTYINNGINCVGEAISFTITVYPTAVMNEVADQTIYSREYTEAIVFTSNVTDGKVIFNWVNDNPAIGLAAEGTGNIPSFMGAAPITSTQVAHITVTPVYSDNVVCEGNSTTFTITVEPTYLVVTAEPIENGTLTDNARVAANGEHYAPAGELITLTATPAAGYVLENVTANMLTNNLVNVPVADDQFFTMPEFDVEVNATFIDDDNLLIKPGVIDLGYRPINAWMYSKFFDVTNISTESFDIMEMDLTDNSFFELDEVELPFTLEAGAATQFGINTNYKVTEPGLKNTTLAMIASHSRKVYTRNVVGTAYTPVTPDVWEKAANVTEFPYVSTQATKGVIYDNYQLPGETADGYDGVYKLVFDHDVVLNAAVTDGNDPKVVLYDNGFRQVGGPHTNNYHDAPLDMDNVAILGQGSLTSGYAPYYTYYKYSLSQAIYTADELAAAGLMAGKMNSIEYFTNSTNYYTRDNISIWMANVSDAAMTTTSVSTAGMALVFTGSYTQVDGWNEFVFNGDEFYWDGTSNIMVTFVMNHGAYNSSTLWLCSNPGFAATGYAYTDNAAYDPTAQSYALTVPSTPIRPNTKFNGAPVQSEGVIVDGSPIEDLGLFAGTYYLVASSTSDDSYTVEINAEDIPLPLAPEVIYPAHASNGIETPVTFEFALGEYTHEYQLLLGTQYNHQDVVVDWTSNLTNTFNAGELLHNTIYYWRINERNSSGVTEGPLWVFTTELNAPENLTAVDNELYEGEDAVLNWVAPADRSLIGYNVYQDGVKINNAPIVETTYTVEGLTYNMDGYEFAVTAAYDEGESDYSNIVNIQVSGYGYVSGHVYEQDGATGIAGATVTIIGFDEFSELVDFEFTTDENGAYSGNVLAGYFFGLAEKEGYQTVGDNTGIEVEYNVEYPNYDFIMNENYNAVARVVAEEIDANNVHVYWGWDLIEDFESGDLNSYEWANDATYPWVVTTTNPYEGTYCMKSTGEGVNYAVSSISITMEAAEDGLISFYAKISSEATYDKGQFYIDGVSKLTMSGASDWMMKEYSIAAGTHTYKWSYTKDVTMSDNDDCFYIDYINFWHAAEPLPEGMTAFDFENGMQGWTTIDADGDGHDWMMISEVYPSDGGHESSEGVLSQSYASGALTPDNYFVSPQMELGGQFTFWAAAHSTSWAAEHFGVAVSTTGNTNPADFTMLNEWTMTAKGVEPHSVPRDKSDRVGSWYQYTVDLSAYAGQMGYVAIRHFDCTDEFALLVDDAAFELPQSTRSFQSFNVYRRDVMNDGAAQQLATGIVPMEYNDMTWGNVPAGIYQWGVSANYAGNRGESEITWSNKLDKDMNAVVNVTVTTNSNDPVTGAVVTLANVSEPNLNLVYSTILDETGTYQWAAFRKGDYNVTVALDGYETVTATASIWNATNNLSYVLTEIISNVEDLYVSTTGWAMFGEIPSVTPPAGAVTLILTHGDNWQDGSGYQLLLDADATAFGNEIPTSGPMTSSCSVPADLYDAFEYKIPEAADPVCTTSNVVVNNSVSITIPAGTYDWCITNPTPYDRIWIASAQGNVGGRQDDYVFEAGKTYEFNVYMLGSNDATDVTITDGAKNVYANTFAPIPSTGAKSIDDVTPVNNGYVVLPANTRSVEYYNVKLDGVMEGTTTLPFFQHNVEGLVEGETYTTSVQKVYTTGESEWTTFDWVYTPCDNFAGLESGPTAAWQGNDVVLNWVLPGGDTPTPPTPPTGSDSFSFDFEGDMQGWTTIDADGNGLNWYHSSNSTSQSGYDYTGLGHNGSNGFIISQSFIDYDGAYEADNYVVTPQMYDITSGSVLTFFADNANDSYPDNFGVYIATAANPTANDFTMVWQGNAKTNNSKAVVRHDASRYNNWRQHTVNLGAYAGQTVWIAFRHNDYDMYEIWIDDVTLTPGNKGNRDITANFDDGTLGDWTTIDADGDGYEWISWTSTDGAAGYNGTLYTATSASYQGVALNPDNYLVSPQVTLGGTLHFWACAQDASWAAEHFGVAVSTTGNTSGSAFTMIQEWTMTSKGNGQPTSDTRDGSRVQGTWYEYTVDLSSYAGQTGYVAIRHFGCTDMFRLNVDEITLTTSGTPVDPVDPPTPADNVIGVEIFRNGEWIAEVPAPAQTYTDVEQEGANTYEVRVVYDGPREEYLYYAMSCPQAVEVEDNPCIVTPANLNGMYEWVDGSQFGAKITWTYGEFGGWLSYDDGTLYSAIGENTDAWDFEWANMYPVAQVAPYAGSALTQVSFICYDGETMQSGIYTIKIYLGGNNAPATLVHSQDYAFDGNFTGEWVVVDLTTPVAVDGTQNLWIALYNDGVNGHLHYPATFSENGTGGANGRWFSENGGGWEDIANYLEMGNWMIRGYLTNAVEAGEMVALDVENGNGNGSHNVSVADQVFNMKPDFSFNRSHRSPVSFNIYRDGNVVGNVAYDGDGSYEYFDQVAAGNYEYQVTAVYDACESDFALTPDLSQNYVDVHVTSVAENIEARIYPNPTTGNVTIEANGMTHITVISALGQVLYDANVSGDQYHMNLAVYKAGLYMVRIQTENGVSVKRVTVAK